MRVLITGTSQGIGYAIAEYFLNKCHEVIGIDRQEKSIEHKHYRHYVCDVRDYAQVCNARDKAVEVFGRIDPVEMPPE